MPYLLVQNPPRIAVNIANGVFVFCIVLSAFISAYSVYRIFIPVFFESMLKPIAFMFYITNNPRPLVNEVELSFY
jgi:hypothetical protein